MFRRISIIVYFVHRYFACWCRMPGWSFLLLSSSAIYVHQGKSSTLNQRGMERSPPPRVARPYRNTLHMWYGGPSCKKHRLSWHLAIWQVPLPLPQARSALPGRTALCPGRAMKKGVESGEDSRCREGEKADCPMLIQVTDDFESRSEPQASSDSHHITLPGLKLRTC